MFAVTGYDANFAIGVNTCHPDDFTLSNTYDVGHWPFSVFSADFDNDDYNDLAVANRPGDDISILINTAGAIPIKHQILQHELSATIAALFLMFLQLFDPVVKLCQFLFVRGATDTSSALMDA